MKALFILFHIRQFLRGVRARLDTFSDFTLTLNESGKVGLLVNNTLKKKKVAQRNTSKVVKKFAWINEDLS